MANCTKNANNGSKFKNKFKIIITSNDVKDARDWCKNQKVVATWHANVGISFATNVDRIGNSCIYVTHFCIKNLTPGLKKLINLIFKIPLIPFNRVATNSHRLLIMCFM